MKASRSKLIVDVAIFIVALFALTLLVWQQESRLERSAFSTGYLLITAVVFLASYNLRKKLTFLPLGSSSTWLRWHINVGFFTICIFLFHIRFRIPNGVFESVLAGLFCIVALSGVYGLYVTRFFPKRLTAIPDEIVFERVPVFRSQIAMQAKQLAMESTSDSATLAAFYRDKLIWFFETNRSLAYFLFPNGRYRRYLLGELNDVNRYLSSEQKEKSQQLADLVKLKDDVDYHYAMQGKLKVWLFAHIGFSYSLLIFAVLHGFLAHAYHGGVR